MRAMSVAACRTSVDFPIPGSPPSKTSEPGTNPPPRTRLNSSISTGSRAISLVCKSPSRTGAARRLTHRPGARGVGRLDRLHERVPRPAIWTTPEHGRTDMTALLTHKARFCGCLGHDCLTIANAINDSSVVHSFVTLTTAAPRDGPRPVEDEAHLQWSSWPG